MRMRMFIDHSLNLSMLQRHSAAIMSKTAVTAYLKSKQLLLFVFADTLQIDV